MKPKEKEFWFTVDEYCDAIRQRDIRRIERDDKWGAKWQRKPTIKFRTGIEANEFLVERAKVAVKIAEKDLKRARRRLAKCQQWLEVEQRDMKSNSARGAETVVSAAGLNLDNSASLEEFDFSGGGVGGSRE